MLIVNLIILLYISRPIASCNANQYSFFGCHLCSGSIDNCDECSSGLKCTLCFDPYYVVSTSFLSSQCDPCTANCISCLSEEVCDACDSDYKLSHNYTHSYCQSCTSAFCTCSNSQCTDCDDGYYLHSYQDTVSGQIKQFTVCLPCPTGCELCTSNSHCTSCVSDQYYLSSSNLCEQCPEECICDNSTYCTSCASGTYQNNTGGCSLCPSTCVCDNFEYCTSCQTGHYFLDSGECEVCPSTCQCDNSTYCTSCIDDHYFNDSRGCSECPENCVCDNFEYCTSCQPGNYLHGSGDCYACPSTCQCDNSTYCTSCIDENHYFNDSQGCSECPSTCVCDNFTYCTSCQAGHYFLDSGDCEVCPSTCICDNSTYCTSCVDDHYFNDSRGCSECPSVCVCDDFEYCTSCISGYYLNQSGQCKQCPELCYCENSTYCTSCVKDYFINETGECEYCPELCYCNTSNYCTSCHEGAYYDDQGSCYDRCGDQYNLILPCDLELGIDNDGCTDSCELEDGFSCSVDEDSRKDTCSYKNQLSIKVVSMTKQMFDNEITIEFEVSPNLHVFQSVDPNLFLSFDHRAFKSPVFSFSKIKSRFSVTFSYNESIQSSEFKLLFNVSSNLDERFWATQNQQWSFFISPEGQFPAYYYTSQQYTYGEFIYIVGIVISALGWLACIIGIFSPNKLAGLQIMFVIQYSFISMIWFQFPLTLPIYYMNGLAYSLGYNYPIYPLVESQAPSKAYIFGVNTLYFSSNFNIMFVLYLIVLIPLLVYKIKFERQTQKLPKKILENTLEFWTQMMIYATMFNFTYVTTCTAIYYYYGDILNISSEVLAALALTITISTFIGFIALPGFAGRFRFSFRVHNVAFFHYFFHIGCIISTILLILFLPEYPWVPFIPEVIMIIYTIAFRPYKKLSQNIRSVFYYLIMCGITSMRVYFSFLEEDEFQTWASYSYPGIVESLLIFGIIWAYIVVIHDIVYEKFIKKKLQRNLAYELFDEEQTIRKLQKNIIESDMIKAKNILKSFNPHHDDLSQEYRSEKMKKDLKMKEKEKDLPTPKAIQNEKQAKDWLKGEKLPGSQEAVEMIYNEAQFLRYYEKVWLKKEQFEKGINDEEKKIYDEI